MISDVIFEFKLKVEKIWTSNFVTLFETSLLFIHSCQFKWIPGEWEECTSTCGSTGIQHRQIYCVHASVNVTKVISHTAEIIYRDMLPPDRCGPPVRTEQQCNRVPCQGRWVFDEWSAVSEYSLLYPFFFYQNC